MSVGLCSCYVYSTVCSFCGLKISVGSPFKKQTDKSKRFALVWKADLMQLHAEVLQGSEYTDDQPTQRITSKLFKWYYGLVPRIAAIEENLKEGEGEQVTRQLKAAARDEKSTLGRKRLLLVA